MRGELRVKVAYEFGEEVETPARALVRLPARIGRAAPAGVRILYVEAPEDTLRHAEGGSG